MAPRLPTPGGDAGNWGEILNEYLGQSHEDDGSLKPIPKATLDQSLQDELDDHASRLDTAESTLSNQGTQLTNTDKLLLSQKLGLAAPNPGITRLRSFPTVMSSPPVITPGSSGGASVISSSVLVAMTNSAFTYLGCPAAQGASFPNNGYVACDLHPTMMANQNYSVEFEWYGSQFELELKGTAQKYRLVVDDQNYDDWLGRVDTTSDGNRWRIHYNFTTPAIRRIRFDMWGGTFVGGIRVGPNDTIWKTSRPIGPRVIVTGDSFCEYMHHWPIVMGWLLGWTDVWIVGRGSTGYLDVNAGNDTYRQRAVTDIYPWDPDIVIVSGGLNDSTLTPAAVGAEAATFYQEIRQNCPNASLIVSGFNSTNGSPANANWVQVRDAIRAAAEQHADLHIDQVGGPYPYSGMLANYTNAGWMTGTGRVGATTGSGNSDIFRGTDNTHPSTEGHLYRGYRHAAAIAAAMPILKGSS